MDPQIQTWIDALDAGQTVVITTLAEIFNCFTALDITSVPSSVQNQGNVNITGIEQTEEDLVVTSITFTVAFNANLLGFMTGRYTLQNFTAEITVYWPESAEDIDLSMRLQGDMTVASTTLDLLVSLQLANNETGEKEWQLVILLDNTTQDFTTFVQAKSVLNISTLEECVPDIFWPLDDLALSAFGLKLATDLETIEQGNLKLYTQTWVLLSAIQLQVNEPALGMEITMPYVADEVHMYVEGQVQCGTSVLPGVRVHFPTEASEIITVAMIDTHYAIGSLGELQSFLTH